jgi:hypothetical protein
MSEKATLLTSIPPVSKSEPVQKTSLLTPINPVETGASKPTQLLQPLNNVGEQKGLLSEISGIKEPVQPKVKDLNLLPVVGPSGSAAPAVVDVPAEQSTEVSSTEGKVLVPAETESSGASSGVIIISVAVVLCLVAAAVVLFLKKSKGGVSKSVVGAGANKKAAEQNTNDQPEIDPIIDFLNNEPKKQVASAPAATTQSKRATEAKPAASTKPVVAASAKSAHVPAAQQVKKPNSVARSAPPQKPTTARSAPPKKPTTTRSAPPKKPNSTRSRVPSAPNAPEDIKAPSKPKKRF